MAKEVNLKYEFGKDGSYVKHYKQYLHLTEYTETTTTARIYVADSVNTFLLRNPVEGTVESTSAIDFTNGTANIYAYGEKYTLVFEQDKDLTVDTMDLSRVTVRINNPNTTTAVQFNSQNLPDGEVVNIAAGKSATYEWSWSKAQTEPETMTITGNLTAANCNESPVIRLVIEKDIVVGDLTLVGTCNINSTTGVYSGVSYVITNPNTYSVKFKGVIGIDGVGETQEFELAAGKTKEGSFTTDGSALTVVGTAEVVY